MEKIRFGLIGSGWRSEFFVRIAKAIPDLFELTSVLVRDKEHGGEFSKKFDVPVVQNIDELEKTNMDYVVLCTKREAVFDYLKDLYARNIPVLCETPPSDEEKVLEEIWTYTQEHYGKIQVIEQYFLQPIYVAWQKILDKGLLGNVENMTITSLSGYHAVSIIRKYMEAGFENCSIIGDAHTFHVTKTKTRGGACYDGEVVKNHRHRLTLSFDNGKTAFYDFQSVQAHTYIRTRQLNIQGVRGEIDDLEVRYLTDDNVAVKSQLNRVDAGVYHNSEWSHVGIMLHDEYLYKNPFINARLNDDELAMAECMFKMSEYVKTGKEFYSLREALQDTYLSIKMTEAVNHPYTEIKTEKKLWCE